VPVEEVLAVCPGPKPLEIALKKYIRKIKPPKSVVDTGEVSTLSVVKVTMPFFQM
jgi:hypothetical protein